MQGGGPSAPGLRNTAEGRQVAAEPRTHRVSAAGSTAEEEPATATAAAAGPRRDGQQFSLLFPQ